MLMRAPRLASALLLGTLAVWSVAAVVLSAALAGLAQGPQLFAGAAADVCQRCVAAASPFSAGGPVSCRLPIAVLVMLPLAGTVLMGSSPRGPFAPGGVEPVDPGPGPHDGLRTVVAGRTQCCWSRTGPRSRFARRHGGIVLRGLMDSLTPQQLSAVLARGRRICPSTITRCSPCWARCRVLRMIPLFDAVATTVPHLLEIAADDASRHRSGTPALASALLRLAEAGAARQRPSRRRLALLHATGPAGSGPDRIGHLVSPAAARSALMPTAALAGLLAVLGGSAVVLVAPYAVLLLNGCAVPL